MEEEDEVLVTVRYLFRGTDLVLDDQVLEEMLPHKCPLCQYKFEGDDRVVVVCHCYHPAGHHDCLGQAAPPHKCWICRQPVSHLSDVVLPVGVVGEAAHPDIQGHDHQALEEVHDGDNVDVACHFCQVPFRPLLDSVAACMDCGRCFHSNEVCVPDELRCTNPDCNQVPFSGYNMVIYDVNPGDGRQFWDDVAWSDLSPDEHVLRSVLVAINDIFT